MRWFLFHWIVSFSRRAKMQDSTLKIEPVNTDKKPGFRGYFGNPEVETVDTDNFSPEEAIIAKRDDLPLHSA
ncbi:MAG: hypothetical protein FJZ43_01995 [Candidatus Staskawiczbacteria bacterium]|nr:hypothetical protein [Candidatus Staskawiczbacteria bacterium]